MGNWGKVCHLGVARGLFALIALNARGGQLQPKVQEPRKRQAIALVSESELDTIRGAAREDGLSVSEFVRARSLGRRTKPPGKLSASQAEWNARVGKLLVQTLERERKRQKMHGRTEADAAYEIELESVLSEVGRE